MIFYQIDLKDSSHSVQRNRMAGRVQIWIRIPGRPSTKGYLLILHFAVDVKRIVEEGKDYSWPRPEQCPACQSRRLWGHGYVRRYFEGWSEGIWIKRYRCPECRAVHTLRPEGFYKGFYYRTWTILLSLLNRIIHGDWVRGLSRQVQQYWWRGLRKQASRFHNVKVPDRVTLRQILAEGIIPVTHSFQCEILRL